MAKGRLYVPGASHTCDCLCVWVKKASREKVRMDCYVLFHFSINTEARPTLERPARVNLVIDTMARTI